MSSSRNGTNDKIRVKTSRIQGKGVFAAKRIRKGERVIEYIGERISVEEESKRYDDVNMSRHHTFLFSIDEKTTLDAAVGGNAARFINHSCEPNCEAVNEDGRIFIEAIRNIQPGTELSYDYNFSLDEPLTEELLKRYPCHCGAKNCRGTILQIKKSKRSNKKTAGKRKQK